MLPRAQSPRGVIAFPEAAPSRAALPTSLDFTMRDGVSSCP